MDSDSISLMVHEYVLKKVDREGCVNDFDDRLLSMTDDVAGEFMEKVGELVEWAKNEK
jgi:hypothetical protein